MNKFSKQSEHRRVAELSEEFKSLHALYFDKTLGDIDDGIMHGDQTVLLFAVIF